jgi:hypothetical protein
MLRRVVVATLLVFALTAASAHAAAVRANPACTNNVLGHVNDGPTSSIALPFAVDLFGRTYTKLWLNNNGFVNFSSPIVERPNTRFDLTSVGQPVIAPFFADVDTRTSTGQVTWGFTTVGGANAFCANWVDVGYADGQSVPTNAFQLVLIDRSQTTGVPGDFDVEFNYDRIAWETGAFHGGTGGLGGFSARAGYSNGDSSSPQAFELLGSAVPGALLDGASSGLIHHTHGTTALLGRYTYVFHGGTAETGARVSGRVIDSTLHGVHSRVEICDTTTPGPCTLVTTNATGDYTVSGLVDTHAYTATANPVLIGLGSASASFTAASPATTAPDIVYTDPDWVASGATVFPWHYDLGGHPGVDGTQKFDLTFAACPGGTVMFTMASDDGTVILRDFLHETGVGTGSFYTEMPPLPGRHGHVSISFDVRCPGQPDSRVTIGLYIDPSGRVLTTTGKPIPAATVTLYSAPSASGPFTPVPDGSTVMSERNRTNADRTDAGGHYGWDVLAGFYKVRAEKAGCADPADATKSYVESGVLDIPPEVTNLDLVLSCPVSESGSVSGTVPATLSLTLGAPATFGAFTPGVAKDYTASTTAVVTSTAGNAALTVADPGHLTNGAFSLPEPLRVDIAPPAWTGPVSNASVAIAFRQRIGATDALRTGTYAKAVTFTLSTTAP